MLTNILILLLFLLILTSFSIEIKKAVNKPSIYPFQNAEKADLPIITVNVQDKVLNMIADSAASVSIIKKSSLEGIDYKTNGRYISVSAVTDENCVAQAISIPIEINGKTFETDFGIQDVDDFANYRKNYGMELDGLLGAEFFRITKGVVNFTKQQVEFP